MTPPPFDYRPFLPPGLRPINWRAHPLDGALLLFDRDTGLNVKLEGDETAHLRRVAPRTLLVGVTNVCNLSCGFCYRSLKSPSEWTYDSLLDFCQQADAWGVLEMAFGGGEPTLFPHWREFLHALYDTTGLCANFTTNGTRLTDAFLRDIAGKFGNIRLSLYDDNDYETTIRRLVDAGARFGVNWLLTPGELAGVERKFTRLLELGVRDFLLLSYKGADTALHLRPADYPVLGAFVNRVHAALGGVVAVKLDVCWGGALPDVPRLFAEPDCGAGDGFLSITSDRHIKPCSFHQWTVPFETLDDVRGWWARMRARRVAAATGGCARLPARGLDERGGLRGEVIRLATVQ